MLVALVVHVRVAALLSFVFLQRRFLAFVGSVAFASTASAHHSGAAYDMTRSVTIEGTVTALLWKNPHIYMTVETKDSGGALRFHEIEVMSVSQARGLGLRREAISPGARVVVHASPSRRGSREMAFGIAVTTSDGTEMPLSSYAGFSALPPPDAEARGLAGTWAPTVESFARMVGANGAAPVTAAGRAAREEVLRRYAVPSLLGDDLCEPLAPPLLHVFPDPRTIEVADTSVVIRTETNGVKQERVVHLHQKTHPPGLAPRVEGHSIGWWEGETLVIDTVAFAASSKPDLMWLPTHPGRHLVERLSLSEDRRHLEYEVKLDIPEYLAKPATWQGTWDHRPDLEPLGEPCDPEAALRFLEEVHAR